MHNLKILLKNNFNMLVGKLKGKKNITTQKATGLLIIGIIALYALYFFQAYTMIDGFAAYNVEKLALFHACITATSVILILGIMRSAMSNSNSDVPSEIALNVKSRLRK